jgi:hypothetical protein
LDLEKRALGGHGRQRQRHQRHQPVKPCRVASEIHFSSSLVLLQW